MYNETLKREYLFENRERSNFMESHIARFFNNIAPTEERLDKDLSNFTTEEIMNYYKSLCTCSIETLMVINSQYKLYTAYCMNKHLVRDCQNHYAEIDNSILSLCINSGLCDEKIIDRETLKRLAEDLPNASDRFLIYALYEGICGANMNEVTHVCLSDIHDGVVELCTGRTVSVSDELVKAAKEANQEEDYKAYSFTETGDVYISEQNKLRYDMTDPHIIKRMSNADPYKENERKRAYSKLVRIRKFLGTSAISTAALLEAGRIEIIKRYMQAENLTPEQAISKHRAEVEDGRGKIPSMSRYLLRYGEYLK